MSVLVACGKKLRRDLRGFVILLDNFRSFFVSGLIVGCVKMILKFRRFCALYTGVCALG